MTGRFRGTKDGTGGITGDTAGMAAQQKIQTAARQSPLLSEAQKNTQFMLAGMLRSLGFQQVTVIINFS